MAGPNLPMAVQMWASVLTEILQPSSAQVSAIFWQALSTLSRPYSRLWTLISISLLRRAASPTTSGTSNGTAERPVWQRPSTLGSCRALRYICVVCASDASREKERSCTLAMTKSQFLKTFSLRVMGLASGAPLISSSTTMS